MSRKTVSALMIAAGFAVLTQSAPVAEAGGCYGGRCYPTRIAYARPFVYHRVRPVVGFAHAPRENLASAPSGSTLTLPANFLGEQPGSVFLVFNNIKLPVEILKWANNGVTIKLPPIALRHPLRVRLDAISPHGELSLQQRLLITPPADIILHPTAPTPPLPTNAALFQNGAIPAGE